MTNPGSVVETVDTVEVKEVSLDTGDGLHVGHQAGYGPADLVTTDLASRVREVKRRSPH